MTSKSPYLLISIAILAADQLTKEWVDRSLFIHESRTVIPDFFNLVHTRNTGAVFGVFQDTAWPIIPKLLMLLSMAALGLILLFFYRSSSEEKLNLVGLSMILGGAAGNIIDRIFRASVVDFLEFYIGSFHWPAFNVADSAICTGIFLLLLRALREHNQPTHSHDPAAEHQA